jgi:hypothetical protein
MELITAAALDSPARTDAPSRSTVRAVSSDTWRADAAELTEVLDDAVGQAAQAGRRSSSCPS